MGMIMGNLALPHICHAMLWLIEMGPPFISCHLCQVRRVGTKFMKLALFLTSCNSWQTRLCTLPGQYNRALLAWVQENLIQGHECRRTNCLLLV